MKTREELEKELMDSLEKVSELKQELDAIEEIEDLEDADEYVSVEKSTNKKPGTGF